MNLHKRALQTFPLSFGSPRGHHPNFLHSSAPVSVPSVTPQTYEVRVEDFLIPVDQVKTLEQLKQADFKWDIIAMGGGDSASASP